MHICIYVCVWYVYIYIYVHAPWWRINTLGQSSLSSRLSCFSKSFACTFALRASRSFCFSASKAFSCSCASCTCCNFCFASSVSLAFAKSVSWSFLGFGLAWSFFSRISVRGSSFAASWLFKAISAFLRLLLPSSTEWTVVRLAWLSGPFCSSCSFLSACFSFCRPCGCFGSFFFTWRVSSTGLWRFSALWSFCSALSGFTGFSSFVFASFTSFTVSRRLSLLGSSDGNVLLPSCSPLAFPSCFVEVWKGVASGADWWAAEWSAAEWWAAELWAAEFSAAEGRPDEFFCGSFRDAESSSSSAISPSITSSISSMTPPCCLLSVASKALLSCSSQIHIEMAWWGWRDKWNQWISTLVDGRSRKHSKTLVLAVLTYLQTPAVWSRSAFWRSLAWWILCSSNNQAFKVKSTLRL